ncbi:protein of unknown function (plasmid) [Agrobacterium pusense]|uniref:Uncharacterized protein n=1 Tax=Agrobacterium pusense TaxID=648995 RepID=U4Q8J3_9HYPH|nr:protein of unknown function [Agrobacterium pusense]
MHRSICLMIKAYCIDDSDHINRMKLYLYRYNSYLSTKWVNVTATTKRTTCAQYKMHYYADCIGRLS